MSDFPHLKKSSLKIDFDASGPKIGPIQLLDNTSGRFCPAPIETLEQKLARAFAASYDCSPWIAGLDAICLAMNDRAVAALHDINRTCMTDTSTSAGIVLRLYGLDDKFTDDLNRVSAQLTPKPRPRPIVPPENVPG